MGMFDSVYFACAECGHRIEEQSSAAEEPFCNGYAPESVPVCIAAHLVEVSLIADCTKCGARHLIEFADPMQHVAMKLVAFKDE